jgi:hypothetical protein
MARHIVKQLDSILTSERLEVNVSNECISKVGACLYTNQLHQTKELRSMVKEFRQNGMTHKT